jgi:hypothetical protein
MAKSDWKNPSTQFTKEDFDAMVKDSVLTLQARQCVDQLKELRDSIDDLEKQAKAGILLEIEDNLQDTFNMPKISENLYE